MTAFAGTGELFRYRLQTKSGRQFEYVFESSAQPSARSINKEEAIKIAADWMATFYHWQLGGIENVELHEKPVPYWPDCLADTSDRSDCSYALHVDRQFFTVTGSLAAPELPLTSVTLTLNVCWPLLCCLVFQTNFVLVPVTFFVLSGVPSMLNAKVFGLPVEP